MKRLVALVAAFVLAALATFSLVTWRGSLRESSVHGDTDPASRQRLEGVIQTEREEDAP